jgi:hypothetical protein
MTENLTLTSNIVILGGQDVGKSSLSMVNSEFLTCFESTDSCLINFQVDGEVCPVQILDGCGPCSV